MISVLYIEKKMYEINAHKQKKTTKGLLLLINENSDTLTQRLKHRHRRVEIKFKKKQENISSSLNL